MPSFFMKATWRSRSFGSRWPVQSTSKPGLTLAGFVLTPSLIGKYSKLRWALAMVPSADLRVMGISKRGTAFSPPAPAATIRRCCVSCAGMVSPLRHISFSE